MEVVNEHSESGKSLMRLKAAMRGVSYTQVDREVGLHSTG
jgi:hypothetical protein